MKLLWCIALTHLLFYDLAFAQTTLPVPYDNNPAAGKYYDINGFQKCTPKPTATARRFS